MSKTILHIDLDTFYVSVERLLNRELQNRPLLVGGTGDRGVVAACSYETRGFGVHSGMPMKMARQLCPEAVVIRGNSGEYSKHSDIVTEIVKEHVPLFEKSSVDEFYADLTGMDRFFGCYQYASEMRTSESRLAPSSKYSRHAYRCHAAGIGQEWICHLETCQWH